MTTLYVVVPCYNEEEVLPETSKRLAAKLTALETQGRISPDSRVLFVDDGSSNIEVGQALGFVTYQPKNGEDWREAVNETIFP